MSQPIRPARVLSVPQALSLLITAVTTLIMAALLMFAAAAPSAADEDRIRENIGDWQFRCDQPPGARSGQCALIQNVTDQHNPNVGLTVIILRTADDADYIMRVVAPLGVVLPAGLGLRVDGEDVGRAFYNYCTMRGCQADIILKEDEVSTLQAGSTATFIIFATPEEGIGIPVSLSGFAEGYPRVGRQQTVQ